MPLNSAPTDGGEPAAGWPLVIAQVITQIIAWGSIYYGFALLLDPLQQALGTERTAVVGAFSAAPLVSGVLASVVGRTIDRFGGRTVMTAGSIAGGVLLAQLSRVESVAALHAVWTRLGAAMAATLYEPAFAVLTQVFRAGHRRAITRLTLFGGFASTVFRPLATALIERYGRRGALLVLAAPNLAVCAPLHAWLLPRIGRGVGASSRAAGADSRTIGDVLADRSFYRLAFAFLAHAQVVAAMGVHVIAMLVAKGSTPLDAAGVGAMVGPMQVPGRLTEFAESRRMSAVQVGRIAVPLQPLALHAFSQFNRRRVARTRALRVPPRRRERRADDRARHRAVRVLRSRALRRGHRRACPLELLARAEPVRLSPLRSRRCPAAIPRCCGR